MMYLVCDTKDKRRTSLVATVGLYCLVTTAVYAEMMKGKVSEYFINDLCSKW